MNINTISADLYLKFVNDFITVAGFAAYYGFSIGAAHAIIREGRIDHEARISTTL